MMGVGKSAIGREIAAATGREFVDTDRLLTHRLGRPIPQLFELYGEDAFRSHETALLRSLEPGPMILSTGGGMVQREENWTEFRRLGMTLFLDVPPEILIERLATSKKRRPLLEVENWQDRVRQLLAQRRPFYERADLRVELGGSSIATAGKFALQAFQEAEACR
jgi:shikimate kinase